YNKDGDFTDSGEQIGSGNGSGEISGSINIDANASGTTRMRVTMKYNAAPTSCETFSYGEVEDYTVSFSGKGVTAMEELAETNISIYPQPADELVHIDMNTTSNTAEVRMYNMNGQLVKATQLDYNGQGFDLDVAGQSEGMYMLQIVTGNEIHSERIVIE
ncbi:MAG TPA: GEVED domain-containing protein, partial [Salinivirga sp.]|uniref:GEVED domain-containing protein n=1 Tax=Salinivirga sp. TaxID=1970192 RepID=UPI002B479360